MCIFNWIFLYWDIFDILGITLHFLYWETYLKSYLLFINQQMLRKTNMNLMMYQSSEINIQCSLVDLWCMNYLKTEGKYDLSIFDVWLNPEAMISYIISERYFNMCLFYFRSLSGRVVYPSSQGKATNSGCFS